MFTPEYVLILAAEVALVGLVFFHILTADKSENNKKKNKE